MSYTNDQWRSAITKLLRLTSTNEIRWEPAQLETPDAWTILDRSLQAAFRNKLYVVSQTRTKYYHDEDSFSWQGGFSLSIFENLGLGQYQKIASAPALSSLDSLYEAAEANMAFNRDALDGLLD